MKITASQSRELLERFGCYVTEACDKCGRFLGWVRYDTPILPRPATFPDRFPLTVSPAFPAALLPRLIPAGVSSWRLSPARNKRGYRLGVEKTPLQLAGNKELAGAKMGSPFEPANRHFALPEYRSLFAPGLPLYRRTGMLLNSPS